jgi:hypothetical protein
MRSSRPVRRLGCRWSWPLIRAGCRSRASRRLMRRLRLARPSRGGIRPRFRPVARFLRRGRGWWSRPRWRVGLAPGWWRSRAVRVRRSVGRSPVPCSPGVSPAAPGRGWRWRWRSARVCRPWSSCRLASRRRHGPVGRGCPRPRPGCGRRPWPGRRPICSVSRRGRVVSRPRGQSRRGPLRGMPPLSFWRTPAIERSPLPAMRPALLSRSPSWPAVRQVFHDPGARLLIPKLPACGRRRAYTGNFAARRRFRLSPGRAAVAAPSGHPATDRHPPFFEGKRRLNRRRASPCSAGSLRLRARSKESFLRCSQVRSHPVLSRIRFGPAQLRKRIQLAQNGPLTRLTSLISTGPRLRKRGHVRNIERSWSWVVW